MASDTTADIAESHDGLEVGTVDGAPAIYNPKNGRLYTVAGDDGRYIESMRDLIAREMV